MRPRTLLVVGTAAVVVFVLVLLGAPGLFRSLVTYKIYVDNAAGIKQGAVVMLAGRKIGQVQKLYSPVSKEEERRAEEAAAVFHPEEPNASPTPSTGKPKYEARIDVQVDRNAVVYRDGHVEWFQSLTVTQSQVPNLYGHKQLTVEALGDRLDLRMQLGDLGVGRVGRHDVHEFVFPCHVSPSGRPSIRPPRGLTRDGCTAAAKS